MTNLLSLGLDEQARATLRVAAARALALCPPESHEEAHQLVGREISHLLDLDVTDLVVNAWSSCDQLVAEAERTRDEPGSAGSVVISEQHFDVSSPAVLEIEIDATPPIELPIELDIDLAVESLKATLRDGCIDGLTSGRCTLTATLVVGGIALPPRKATVDLTVTVKVQPPIPLCRPRPAQPAQRGKQTRPPHRPPPAVIVLPDAAPPHIVAPRPGS